MKLRFHHVGLAARSLVEAVEAMGRIGQCQVLGEEVADPRQRVSLQMVDWNGLVVEVISSEVEGNPIAGFLKKGVSLYHLCYETDDLPAAIAQLREQGWLEVSPSQPATLFEDRPVAFLYHPVLGMIELLQE